MRLWFKSRCEWDCNNNNNNNNSNNNNDNNDNNLRLWFKIINNLHSCNIPVSVYLHFYTFTPDFKKYSIKWKYKKVLKNRCKGVKV